MSHERVAATFDRWAAEGRDAGMEAEHGDVARQVLEVLQVRPGEQILDLGCGNGWATRLLAKSAAGATAVGVDVSPRMIARAEELHSLTVRARYELCAFENLGFRDSRFDRVFSVEALYYAVDLDRALSEAHRVLKPGGRADVIVDFFVESPSTREWPSKTGLSMHYLSTQDWREAFQRAGFTGVHTERLFDTRPTPPSAAAHQASKADGSLWIRATKPS